MIQNFIKAWDHFWFSPVDTLKLSLMRVLMGCLMLWMYLMRAMDFREFFSDEGMIPHAQAPELMQDFYRPLLFLGAHSYTAPLYAVLILLIVLFILGVGGRLTSLLLLMVHLSFVQRNFSVVYGVELVIACWLFYLSIGCPNRYFSFLGRALSQEPVLDESLSSRVALRLIQLQLCAIYGFTGLEKLKGDPWWEGSAVWSVLGNKQLMLADFSIVQSLPTLVAIGTFASLIFEIYFPLLVWLKPARKWVLIFGLLFHGTIACTMGLVAFGCMMTLGYVAFADDQWLRQMLVRYWPASADR